MGIGNLETIDRDVLRRKMLQTDRASETLTVAMVEEIGMTGMVSRPLLKELLWQSDGHLKHLQLRTCLPPHLLVHGPWPRPGAEEGTPEIEMEGIPGTGGLPGPMDIRGPMRAAVAYVPE